MVVAKKPLVVGASVLTMIEGVRLACYGVQGLLGVWKLLFIIRNRRNNLSF